MLGIFALLGTVGVPLYAGYVVKKDIESMSRDYRVKPSPSVAKNKETIRREFDTICKRCEMRRNKQGEILDERYLNVAIEYLQYQGFDNESIELFEELFEKNFKGGLKRQTNEIKAKHQRYIEIMNKNPYNWDYKIFRQSYYGSGDIKRRVKKISENELWSKILNQEPQCVDNIEIYSIYAPKRITNNIDKIYEEVCWIQGLDDNKW